MTDEGRRIGRPRVGEAGPRVAWPAGLRAGIEKLRDVIEKESGRRPTFAYTVRLAVGVGLPLVLASRGERSWPWSERSPLEDSELVAVLTLPGIGRVRAKWLGYDAVDVTSAGDSAHPDLLTHDGHAYRLVRVTLRRLEDGGWSALGLEAGPKWVRVDSTDRRPVPQAVTDAMIAAVEGAESEDPLLPVVARVQSEASQARMAWLDVVGAYRRFVARQAEADRARAALAAAAGEGR